MPELLFPSPAKVPSLFELVRQQLQRSLATVIQAQPVGSLGSVSRQLWHIGKTPGLLVRSAPSAPPPPAPAAGRPGLPELLLYEYVPVRLGQRLRAQGTQYADAAGNVWLQHQSLHLHVQGRPRLGPPGTPPPPGRRVELLRLLFCLLHEPAPDQCPDGMLMSFSGLSPAAIRRERQRLPGLAGGPETGAAWPTPTAVQYWLDGFLTYLRSRLGGQRYCWRDPARRPDWLRHQLPAGCIRSGEAAAAQLLGQTEPPATYTLYSRLPRPRLVEALGLVPHAHGRVEILNAFAPAIFAREHTGCAPPLLTYADLLASQQAHQLALARQLREAFLASWLPG